LSKKLPEYTKINILINNKNELKMEVKVFSTQMGEKSITTDATTWGELQRDLEANSIGYSKMKAVIGENKLTLEADGAILPAQGFTLFLMNKRTKAGTDFSKTPYRVCRATIKAILDNDESAKEHFNEGKNYTTKGTDVLRQLLSSFSGVISNLKDSTTKKKGKKDGFKEPKNVARKEPEPVKKNSVIEKAVKEVTKEKKEVVAKVVEPVKVSKEDKKSIEKGHSTVEGHEGLKSLDAGIEMLRTADISDLDRELQEDIESLTTRIFKKWKQADEIYTKALEAEQERIKQEELQAREQAEKEAKEKAKKEEEDRIAEEERKKQEKEAKIAQEKEAKVAEEKKESESKLKNEMKDLMSEFGDVKF